MRISNSELEFDDFEDDAINATTNDLNDITADDCFEEFFSEDERSIDMTDFDMV